MSVCYWVCAAAVGSAELAELEAEESQARPAGAEELGSAEEAAPAARSGGRRSASAPGDLRLRESCPLTPQPG